jgi:hypothetical protein
LAEHLLDPEVADVAGAADLAAADIDQVTEPERRTVPRGATARSSRRSPRVSRWMRTFHVYVSMICMLIVAFFALTGLTLNHPTWSLGGTSTATEHGTVPAGSIANGAVDYLAISEYARTTFGVSGHVKSYGTQGDTGSIEFAAPGYSASVTFSLTDGSLTVTTTQNDLLAVLNDVHKGRDTDSSWRWVIDASAVLLLVVTLTGMGIQVLQRKRRRSALLTAGALAVVTIGLIWIAIH